MDQHPGDMMNRTDQVLLWAVFVCAVTLAPFQSFAIEREVKIPERVPLVTRPIVIDGVIDEEAWEGALVMGVNNETRPGNNIPAPVRTDMLLAYDEDNFYVAFRAFDPDPSLIYAHLCDHDRMWSDEWVVIGIDTYNDQRGGYEFACNPLGIQGDTASGVHGDGNAWDAIWDSAGQISDWGYSVEMAIPFKAIRFQLVDGDQVWGVDAVRSYPRDVRHHISLFARNRDDNCYRCQMDKLIGFAGATSGRNIEIDPTISAVGTQLRKDFPDGDFSEVDDEYEAGVTARWGITPNVMLAGTANPDFSQVEADAFQLDVNTQYALYYEEKRPFFLESSGVFGSFYSRSVASPIWGAKLTSKVGSNAFGVLVAQDEITNIIVSGSQSSDSHQLDLKSTATVVRYQRDIGDMSTVNVHYNGREADGYHNRVAGFDAGFWFTESLSLAVEGEASYTLYPESVTDGTDLSIEEFSDTTYEIRVGNFTSGLDVYANYSNTGDDFQTDLAFMPRVGYDQLEFGGGHTWQRESGSWWTELNLGGSYTYEAYQNDTPRARGCNFWINYDGPKQADASIDGWFGKREYAGEDFDTWSVHADAGFWPNGSLFIEMDAGYGESIDYENAQTGRELTLEPYVEFKLGRALSASVGHTYERFDIDAGRLYTANITFLRTVYQITRRAFVRAIVQSEAYDYEPDNYPDPDEIGSEERALATQLLFSYKINPQTVFFLGYSDGHFGNQDIELTQYERTFFAKIGYAWVM